MAIATHSTGVAAAIDHLQAAIRQQQLLRRNSARAALKAADGLLNQLELLSLKDQQDVPESLAGLISAVRRAATLAGLKRPTLEADCGVQRLMDDVYDLEGELLPRCRLRVHPGTASIH